MSSTEALPIHMLIAKKIAGLISIRAYDAERFETTDGFDNSDQTNCARARSALVVIDCFQRLCHTENDVGTAAADLIGNLLHLVHSQGQDPKQILLNGLGHFFCETGQRENVDTKEPASNQ